MIRSINRNLNELVEEVRDVAPKVEWMAVAYCIDGKVETAIVQTRGEKNNSVTMILGALARLTHTLVSCG